MAKVSFIGLGIMGTGMVGNLVKAGHDVTVWNRTAAKLKEIEKIGAKTVSDPADLLKDADFFMYCLADDAAIKDVITGGHNLAAKVKPGDAAPTLTKNVVKKAATKKKAAKKATGKATKKAE